MPLRRLEDSDFPVKPLPTFLPSRQEVRTRYRVRLLHAARLAPAGVVHREPQGESVLAWSEVRRALAAEVGEPQGVRTLVFDLVTGGSAECGWAVVRFDVEPGDDAVAVARVLVEALPPQRLGASIKSLADEGLAGECYPDVASFEEAALAELTRPAGRP
jgi:hypothetical protein